MSWPAFAELRPWFPSVHPAILTTSRARVTSSSTLSCAQDLTGSLHTRRRLQDDELLQALKASPLTASHAEARTRELMEELIAADHRTAAQRSADQLAQRLAAAAAHSFGAMPTCTVVTPRQSIPLQSLMPGCAAGMQASTPSTSRWEGSDVKLLKAGSCACSCPRRPPSARSCAARYPTPPETAHLLRRLHQIDLLLSGSGPNLA